MTYKKLKQNNIKIRKQYYLEDLTKIKNLDCENIVSDENSYQDIFICYLGCKVSYSVNVKPLHIGAVVRLKILGGQTP